ncbi:MAG: hypothetical protein ACQKBY_05430 [Verrucomicrobiales bacterium]
MLKHLKAAFLVRQPAPLLGALPLNALLIPLILGLGLVHPAFLLIGLGAEIALLFALATNERFRKLVDLPSEQEAAAARSAQRQQLLAKLDDSLRERFLKLEASVRATKSAYDEFNTPAYISEPNSRNLDALAWTYLKLLFARHALSSRESEHNHEILSAKISALQSELGQKQASASVRTSKEATLDLLRKRLAHFDKRSETIAEIEADLARIEAQTDLAHDNARLQAKPDDVTPELAAATMQSVWYYGEADDAIQEIEQHYQAPAQALAES